MRKLALTLVPLLFLACEREPVAPAAVPAPSFQATSTMTRSSFFLDVTTFIACLAQDVRFHGEVPFILHEVINASGGSLVTFQITPTTPVSPPFVAEALTSGTVYVVKASPINQVFVVGPGGVTTIIDRERYVADNRDELRVSFTIHLTINANGDVKVDRAESSGFQCVFR